jgi:hypothetical protein
MFNLSGLGGTFALAPVPVFRECSLLSGWRFCGAHRASVLTRRGGDGGATRRAAIPAPPRAANIRYVPGLHAPLECRWRIDPMTGALFAVWRDPAADAG